eukprot:403336585
MKHKIKKDSSSSLDIMPYNLVPQFKQRGTNKFFEENEYKQQRLSEEEVRKHLIKEDLDELQRCKILLKKQDPVQQLYVIRNSVNIFRENQELQQELLPLVFKLIEKGNEEIQLEAGECFVNVLKHNIIIDPQLHVKMLFELSQKMLKLWSEESLDHWKKVFIYSLKILEDTSLYQSSLNLILQLTEKNQPISSRRAATYLMGKISYIFDNKSQNCGQIEQSSQQQWIQKFKMISQDVNWEIRAQTAQFEELLDDEEEEVQCNALNSLKYAIQVLNTKKIEINLIDHMIKLFQTG